MTFLCSLDATCDRSRGRAGCTPRWYRCAVPLRQPAGRHSPRARHIYRGNQTLGPAPGRLRRCLLYHMYASGGGRCACMSRTSISYPRIPGRRASAAPHPPRWRPGLAWTPERAWGLGAAFGTCIPYPPPCSCSPSCFPPLRAPPAFFLRFLHPHNTRRRRAGRPHPALCTHPLLTLGTRPAAPPAAARCGAGGGLPAVCSRARSVSAHQRCTATWASNPALRPGCSQRGHASIADMHSPGRVAPLPPAPPLAEEQGGCRPSTPSPAASMLGGTGPVGAGAAPMRGGRENMEWRKA